MHASIFDITLLLTVYWDTSREHLDNICFSLHSSLQLKGFYDLDWARRSITGFCVFLGSSLISWKSKKQSIIYLSSFNVILVCEVQWLTYLISEFKIKTETPIVVYCDNQSAKYVVFNPNFHEKTKHTYYTLSRHSKKISTQTFSVASKY